VATWKCWL